MAENFKDYFLTPTDIAIKWGAEGEEVEKKADHISRKFKSILVQLGFNEEEIRFFKSKHTTDAGLNSGSQSDSQIPDGRIYIFRNRESTPDQLEKLFQIFRKTKIFMTEKDRDEVKEILTDILPVCRNIEDILKRDDYDVQYEFCKLKGLLQEINIQEIINGFQRNKQIVKICKKIQDITEELNTISLVNTDKTFSIEIGRNYYQRRIKVERKVDDYYINNLQRGYFEEKIFVSPKQCDNSWRDIYAFQYDLIKKWSDRWKSVIDETKKQEGIINCDIKDKTWEYFISLQKEEKHHKENNKKKLREKKDAFEQCGDLVADICRRCESELKQDFRKAHDSIKESAFKELINIGISVEEIQKIYCIG